MNVVDSSAWLSYFAGNENSKHFAKPIENVKQLIVPSIVLYEVFKCILRERDESSALQAIAHIQQGKIIPLSSSLAIESAQLGHGFKLPLADSVIYTVTLKFDAVLWTQAPHFAKLEKVKYFKRII